MSYFFFKLNLLRSWWSKPRRFQTRSSGGVCSLVQQNAKCYAYTNSLMQVYKNVQRKSYGQKISKKVAKTENSKKFVVLAIFANFDCKWTKKNCQKQTVDLFCHTLKALTARGTSDIVNFSFTLTQPPPASRPTLLQLPSAYAICSRRARYW